MMKDAQAVAEHTEIDFESGHAIQFVGSESGVGDVENGLEAVRVLDNQLQTILTHVQESIGGR